jgi:hypothetical protein
MPVPCSPNIAGRVGLRPQGRDAAGGLRDRALVGAPVGEDDVEVAVVVDVAELEVADAEQARGQVRVGGVGEGAAAVVEEQLALLHPGGAEHDVVVAVVVDVAELDRAAVVGDRRRTRCADVDHRAGVLDERLLRLVRVVVALVEAGPLANTTSISLSPLRSAASTLLDGASRSR